MFVSVQDIALTTKLGGMPAGELTVAGANEIDAILNAIENLNFEKRDVETNMTQIHADMIVKHSEIRNLQLEFNTLDATVTKLQYQKAEANRRLNDMDAQRTALERTLAEMEAKLGADEAEIEQARTEVEQMSVSEQVCAAACVNRTQFMQQRQQELHAAREQLQQLMEEEKQIQAQVQNEKANLYTTETEWTKIDVQMQNVRPHVYACQYIVYTA
jgi:chromosome segregation ATPase